MQIVGWITTFWTLVVLCKALPGRIHVGGLFEADNWEVEMAFKVAVDWMNADNRLLNHSKMIASVERLQSEDSFSATKLACGLLQNGVTAIFGPHSEICSMHVQSICDNLEVPHIKTRWEHRLSRDQLSVNLYPHLSVLTKAYLQIIEIWNWKNFSLVYEEDEAVVRMKDFFIEGEKKNWKMSLHKLQAHDSSSYRNTFWEIKALAKRENTTEHHIVLDVSRPYLYSVLKSAQQVGMMTEHQKYLITSLDFHTINLTDFQYGKTSITGLRLVQEETKEYQHLLREINNRLMQGADKPPLLTTLKTETALLFDSIHLFALSLERMEFAKRIEAFPPVSCNLMNKGIDGTSLINIMKTVKMKTAGLSGLIEFDPEGFRSKVALDIMYLTDHGLKKIGTILPQGQVKILSPPSKSDFQYFELKNSHFRVSTILNPPYTMLRDSSQQMTGNDRYEGYTVDVLDALKELLTFTYEIHEVWDKKYGALNKQTGTWNGMIGEVVNGTADLAIADLTITTTRLQGVDFTLPFMQTGISILFKKPTEKVTSLFSFLLPFSGEVWLLIVIAYTYISILLFLVGRMSPYEWSNPYPCRESDPVEGNCFSLLNSMWWSIGSLLQQGSDVSPTAPATRALTCTWSFFRVIIISSYTANLAAFLTVEKLVSPIENVEDLAKQEKIMYGCVGSGSTKTFFENSNLSIYQKMFKFMQKHQAEAYVKDNDEGVEKVNRGDYAFLMEATTIEYRTERECNLTRVGEPLDSKSYGIAVKKGNHKLRNWLSGGILFLQEEGKLHKFREKWWKQKKGGGKCTTSKTSGNVNELGLGNVGGVILVMNLGLLLSAIVAVVEFFWYQRKLSRGSKESLCSLFLREVKYAIICGSSSKPAPKFKDKKEDTTHGTNGYKSFS